MTGNSGTADSHEQTRPVIHSHSTTAATQVLALVTLSPVRLSCESPRRSRRTPRLLPYPSPQGLNGHTDTATKVTHLSAVGPVVRARLHHVLQGRQHLPATTSKPVWVGGGGPKAREMMVRLSLGMRGGGQGQALIGYGRWVGPQRARSVAGAGWTLVRGGIGGELGPQGVTYPPAERRWPDVALIRDVSVR